MAERGEVVGQIAEVLNRLDEVRWDRYVVDDRELTAFGWIDREDGRSDFVVIELWSQANATLGARLVATSSAARSESIDRRLSGDADGHIPCQRVEHLVGDLVPNVIRQEVADA